MILRGYDWQAYLIYIDDIIVYPSQAEKHLDDAEQVLDVLRVSYVSHNFEKWLLLKNVARYLGHIIKSGRLEIEHALFAILTFNYLRSFLGFVNAYRRFVLSSHHQSSCLFLNVACVTRLVRMRVITKSGARSPRFKKTEHFNQLVFVQDG